MTEPPPTETSPEQPHPRIPDNILADEIIARLNALLTHENVTLDITRLINQRVDKVHQETADHQTIQVSDGDGGGQLGFLGLLNGLVGIAGKGRLVGWGYITAVFDDDTGTLIRFERTSESEI